jgi:ribokinase
MKRWDVVVVGGINTDFLGKADQLPSPGETVAGVQFFTGSGGKGANQAVAAARLGARVALVGRVGMDDRASALLDGLNSEGVFTGQVILDKREISGAALVMVDAQGDKQILAVPGANANVTQRDIYRARSLISSCRVLLMQFEVTMAANLAAARLAQRHGCRVVLDPAPPVRMPAELFPLVDVIRPNAHEAEVLTGIRVHHRASARRAAQALIRRGVKTAIVQAGEEGDLLVNAGLEKWLPRLRVKSVDATGAGDAFVAAFSVALAEGQPLAEAGIFANAAAALATTKVGAQSALPTRAEIKTLLRSR